MSDGIPSWEEILNQNHQEYVGNCGEYDFIRLVRSSFTSNYQGKMPPEIFEGIFGQIMADISVSVQELDDLAEEGQLLAHNIDKRRTK